jgi:hypothetical protein
MGQSGEKNLEKKREEQPSYKYQTREYGLGKCEHLGRVMKPNTLA